MDLGQKVISGEYTLTHLFTHALKHIWYLNDVTCLFFFLTLDAQPKQVELEAIE